MQGDRRSGAVRGGANRTWRRAGALAWVAVLLAILSFLVIYPLLTLLYGALTDTNPVIEGFSLRHLSITNFLKQAGMTALYVTHDQAEAVVLGDRIGVMRDGKLLQMGAPDDIYNRPADLFVANFTGATNELVGTLVECRGSFGTVDIGDGARLEVALMHPLGVGERARIALRPENISIGGEAGANALRARVLDRRYLGTQTVYAIDLCGRRMEVLELGTAARHEAQTDALVTLPRETCWAYRDTGVSHRD
jgi:iron(III) transport system ATP-binding protein